MVKFFKTIQIIVYVGIFIFSPLIPQKEILASGGYKVPHIIGVSNTAGNGTYFSASMSWGSSSVEANVEFHVTKDGTFSGLTTLTDSANTSGDSTFTFRKNGSDGNQSVTVAQNTAGINQDTVNSDSVSEGDTVSIGLTTTAGSIGIASLTILFEADDGSTTQFLMSRGSPSAFGNNNTVRYIVPVGEIITTNFTNESNASNYIMTDAVASNLGVYILDNTRTTDTRFALRKNGALGNQLVTFSGGQTGFASDSINTDSIAADDLINFRMQTFGSGNQITLRNIQLTLTSDNPQEMTLLGGGPYVRSSTGAALYGRVGGGSGNPSGNEVNNNSVLGVDATLSKFSIYTSANASNRNMTITFRSGFSNGNQSVTNNAGVTGWSQDLSNSDVVAPLDRIDFRTQATSAGSGNVTYMNVSQLLTFPLQTSLTQSAYRFFSNTDSTDVGSALATQDTAGTISITGGIFRLRLLLHVADSDLSISNRDFKLQFAQKSGACDTGFSGESYADVTGATVIAYYNNTTPSDGATLTANANDPTHNADTIVNQTYEESNNFTNSVSAITAGQDGKWDFSLIDNGASANTSYCFRVVESDGTLLDTYSVIPEITTAAGGTLSVDIVDGAGSSVASPFLEMGGANVSFSNQTATGTFGISSQKIRVDNGTGTAVWTLSLAADSGATALWDGTTDYDFNDPTANAEDGADTDSFGGQMTVDPSSSTITPEGGCTLTNISSGGSSSYSEGVTDAITIASASSGADTNCYWDITDIDISQTIPAEQPADSYTIDMTLSIIAS